MAMITTVQIPAYEHTTKNGTVYIFMKRKNHYVAFRKELGEDGNGVSMNVNTTSLANFLDTLEIDSELGDCYFETSLL